jgi:cytosine/adenosine deaminase-related metal-dependent hydrolase
MHTLIWAGVALPNPANPPKTQFAVCVEDNRIIAVGSRDELHARYPDAEQVGGEALLLLPAFVNSHDHGRGIGSVSLGVSDDMLEVWLPGLSTQARIDPYLAAAYDGLRLLRSGVGTTAHSHNPLDWRNMGAEARETLRGYQDADIRVVFHPPLIDQNALIYDDAPGFLAGLPPSIQALAQPFLQLPELERDAYIALCDELFETYHDAEHHTIHIQISPAGGQWCSDELILAAVAFARRRQTRVQMHMLETRYQRHYAYRSWGKSFMRHLDEIGALGPWLTLAHMVWVEPDDLALLAERGVGVAHNPSSNLRLRSGVAPVAEMLREGITVGVGLDGHGLDDDQDYLRELRLAWTLQQGSGGRGRGAGVGGQGSGGRDRGAGAGTTEWNVGETFIVDAQTVWRMGTSAGAAITLGANVGLGALEPGALADMTLIDTSDWLFDPGAADPATALVDIALRRASRQDVAHVMVNGRWVVRDGRSQTLDEAAIVAAMRENLRRQDREAQRQAADAVRELTPYIRRFYAAWG